MKVQEAGTQRMVRCDHSMHVKYALDICSCLNILMSSENRIPVRNESICEKNGSVVDIVELYSDTTWTNLKVIAINEYYVHAVLFNSTKELCRSLIYYGNTLARLLCETTSGIIQQDEVGYPESNKCLSAIVDVIQLSDKLLARTDINGRQLKLQVLF